MPKTKTTDEPEVFKQVADAAGRIRTDRPFTPEEARAQDEEHVQRFLAERRKRFGPTQGR